MHVRGGRRTCPFSTSSNSSGRRSWGGRRTFPGPWTFGLHVVIIGVISLGPFVIFVDDADLLVLNQACILQSMVHWDVTQDLVHQHLLIVGRFGDPRSTSLRVWSCGRPCRPMEDVDGCLQARKKLTWIGLCLHECDLGLRHVGQIQHPKPHFDHIAALFGRCISISHDLREVISEHHLEVVLVEDIPIVLGNTICKSIMGIVAIAQSELFPDDTVLSSTFPNEDLFDTISGNSDHSEVRQRLHEDLAVLASFVAHHWFGDVLEELHEVLLRVCHWIAWFQHDVEECTGPCRRFHDRFFLVFWRPELVVPHRLACSASDAFFSTVEVLPHLVGWHNFIIIPIVMPLT